MSELGDLLRKLRGKESLRDAAKRAGLSHNYLSIVEKGVDPRTGSPMKPSTDTLRSLANAYGYPYEELLKVAGVLEKEEVSKEKNELLEDINKLTEVDRRLVEEMVKTLVQKTKM